MKGSRDNVIWRYWPVLVSVHAECASERALIPFRAAALMLRMQQRGEDRTDRALLCRSPDHLDMKIRLPSSSPLAV